MMKGVAMEGATNIRKCAFCTNFYDPTNSVINPKKGLKGAWEYEKNVKKPCRERSNRDVLSQSFCNKFECKV